MSFVHKKYVVFLDIEEHYIQTYEVNFFVKLI